MNTAARSDVDGSPHKATKTPPMRHRSPSVSAQARKRMMVLALAGILTVLLAACGTPTRPAASSATLATQIVQGAPADVFAAASPATMKTVTDAGAADTPTDFVSNTLEIAVPKGNPHKITGLKDFADANRRIALCAPQVPCGAAAVKVFPAAQIVPKPDTLEQDVKATLQKVAHDEVDAALVYKTDVLAAGYKVDGIEFPEAQDAINTYPIATLKESKNPAVAKAFVDYVLSPEGQAVLARAGFAKPSI